MSRKPRTGNDVRPRDVNEKILRLAGHFVTAEVERCDDDGLLPEERDAYVALSNAVADELRRRGKRIGFKLPAAPTGSASEKEGIP